MGEGGYRKKLLSSNISSVLTWRNTWYNQLGRVGHSLPKEARTGSQRMGASKLGLQEGQVEDSVG